MTSHNGEQAWKSAEERLVVMSTAHISAQDADALDSMGFKHSQLIGMERAEGWMITTRHIDPTLASIAFVQGQALARGFSWILFDAGAATIKGLETYDW